MPSYNGLSGDGLLQRTMSRRAREKMLYVSSRARLEAREVKYPITSMRVINTMYYES